MIDAKQYLTFTDEERRVARSMLSTANFMVVMSVFSAIFLPIVVVIASLTDDSGHKDLSGLTFLIAIFLIAGIGIAIWSWWPYRHASVDFKGDQKAVKKTTIERLQKIGFFEMQADSALGIMAGAIYYLWVPDETRSPPHRRFRIGLTLYRELMLYGSGNPIEISYLPKSGMILTIDTPTYHYKAWESRFKRPGNQPQS